MDAFEDYSILAEKQRLKPRKSSSFMKFASSDAQLDPLVVRLVEWNESGGPKTLCAVPIETFGLCLRKEWGLQN